MGPYFYNYEHLKPIKPIKENSLFEDIEGK